MPPTDGFEPTTPAGAAGLAALLDDPAHALVGLDYDGTLAPIVSDPARALPMPGLVDVLAGIIARGLRVAIVTGRPAATAVSLGGLSRLAEGAGRDSLLVLGQYGFERWPGRTGEIDTADPPEGLARARAALGPVLSAAGVTDAMIEDKGLAVAVHVRRSADPADALRRITEPLLELAERTGLTAEPGRFVVELRPPGMDKGRALRALADELRARTLIFVGDDLGDLAAFDAVDAWREQGRPGLLVCSGSDEVTVLADRADLVVDGPPGVLALLTHLTRLLDHPPLGV